MNTQTLEPSHRPLPTNEGPAELYPAAPTDLPRNLTQPPLAYRVRAWLAALALGGFVVLYVGLIYWSSWLTFECYRQVAQGKGLGPLMLGFTTALLTLVLVKGLLSRSSKGSRDRGEELTPQSQPELFAFLHRLADEIGAPRPRRVFVDASVNAAVTSELSLANLLLPAKKDLQLGLGLVNVLTLSEFKAVLGHEFGHFAQQVSAIGRWLYVAQRVAANVVVRRDWIDEALASVSRWDFRIAWVGWLLRTWLWSLRSILDATFTAVVLVERSLSREMEYQADLVAVSAAGSDALIRALYRLEVADLAWDDSLEIASKPLGQGYLVPDLCHVQSLAIEHRARVLNRPDYGTPPSAESDLASHRIFRDRWVQPPRMWSTHPSNVDRENNAKARYVAASNDERPAWGLFRDTQSLRLQLTRGFLAAWFEERAPNDKHATLQALPSEDVEHVVADHFSFVALQPRYRGVYLGRTPVLDFTREEIMTALSAARDTRIALESLYPNSIAEVAEAWRNQRRDVAHLKGISRGELAAVGGALRYQGDTVAKRDLPRVIADAEARLSALEANLKAHEMTCRSTYQAIARERGNDWAVYHRSLVLLAHYSSHSKADLLDVIGVFTHTFAVLSVDGVIDAQERTQLTSEARQVHAALQRIASAAQEVVLPWVVQRKLGIESWRSALPRTLPGAPTVETLPDWMNHFTTVVAAYERPLTALGVASVEALLETEFELAAAHLEHQELAPAPAPASSPPTYPILVPGRERTRGPEVSLWERVMYGNSLMASVGRAGLAAAALVPLGYAAFTVSNASLHVYNGLALPISVTTSADESAVTIFSHSSSLLPVPRRSALAVTARTLDGELIDGSTLDTSNDPLVFNVANAALLTKIRVSYGNGREPSHVSLGAPHSMVTAADYIFQQPPDSMSVKRGTTIEREVLWAFSDLGPDDEVGGILMQTGGTEFLTSHALWDPPGSGDIDRFMAAAKRAGTLPRVLKARLERNPRDEPAQRARALLER